MLALSTALFSSGCEHLDKRLVQASRTAAEAGLVDQALAIRSHPALPADCRIREQSGVKAGDRLDIALLKSERALGRANARVERCADFYEKVVAAGAGSAGNDE